MQRYDTIGLHYNSTRKPDPRITDSIIRLLDVPSGSLIADIGAGTGNYSLELADRKHIVHALEPSDLMIRQAKNHPNVKWYRGVAERIPFPDATYHGVVSTLASHHFSSLETAFKEIHRILSNDFRFVLFTFDPRLVTGDNWIRQYFEPLCGKSIDSVPPQNEIIEMLEKQFKKNVIIVPFELPRDLIDRFFYSGWAKPESYLDESFRRGISSFSEFDELEIDKMVRRLSMDLANQEWDRQYNKLRTREFYNAGYYFAVVSK